MIGLCLERLSDFRMEKYCKRGQAKRKVITRMKEMTSRFKSSGLRSRDGSGVALRGRPVVLSGRIDILVLGSEVHHPHNYCDR